MPKHPKCFYCEFVLVFTKVEMQLVTRLDNFDEYLIGWLKAWSWYMPARFNYLCYFQNV